MSDVKSLSVKVGSLELKNPIIAASGTFGYGLEYKDYYPPGELGAVIVKGVSVEPMTGNETPRICETTAGMLNAIGLQNPGLEAFIRDKVPLFESLGAPVLINLFGQRVKDFPLLAKRLSECEGIAGFELNISCPNVEAGGLEFASDPKAVRKIVEAVCKVTSFPVWVKLAPYYGIAVDVARAAEEGGASALTVANTYPALAIDIERKRPLLANITGGLSGPAIKPLTLYHVWKIAERVKIPIVASGGVMGAEDAVEYLMAGACAVQIGTVHFVNPAAGLEIVSSLRQWLEKSPYSSLAEVVGLGRVPSNS
ncbi:MAG: dihydroorotate dehydrogenase [Deltaproteobacteria bacterium]|nr:dihydroorotate dehydrogenase [Deltaproteobacteria bacterium]